MLDQILDEMRSHLGPEDQTEILQVFKDCKNECTVGEFIHALVKNAYAKTIYFQEIQDLPASEKDVLKVTIILTALGFVSEVC